MGYEQEPEMELAMGLSKLVRASWVERRRRRFSVRPVVLVIDKHEVQLQPWRDHMGRLLEAISQSPAPIIR